MPPADLAIRLATPADLPALLPLFRGFMDYLGDPSPPDAELADAIRPVLSDEQAELLLAEDGQPLGYAHLRYYYSVWMAALECFIEDLFVVEARRDAGIGARLLAASFARAQEHGCKRVRLDTNQQNARSIHLYERLGFSCRRDSYNGAPQLYYTKYLDDA